MVIQTTVKIYKVNSRHTIYLPKDFINDSAFPFNPKEKLIARIEDKKIVIQKAPATSNRKKGEGV
jgi:hypothetical protein